MQKVSIIETRENLGMTQEQFADFIGVSRGYLSQIECGLKPPSKKILRTIEKKVAENSPQKGSKDIAHENSANIAQEEEVCPICNRAASQHPVRYQPREVAAYVLDNNEKLQRIDNTIAQMSDVLKMVTHLDEFVERKIDAQNDKLFTFIAGICNVLLTELSVTVTILLSESQSNTYAIDLINQAKEQVQDLLRFAKSRGH